MATESSFWDEADDFWNNSNDDNWEDSLLSEDEVIINDERNNNSFFDDEDGDDEWFHDLMREDEEDITSSIPQDIKSDPSLSKWIPTTTAKKTSDTARYAFDYLNKKGIPRHVSAGIVGNLMKESNLNPGSVERGNTGNGRGIAQWDVRNRWKDYQNFAKQRGGDSLESQLDFVIHEAQQRGDLEKTLQASTPQEAAMIFGRNFERPSEKYADWNTRQAYANDLYNMKYGGRVKAQNGVVNVPQYDLSGISDESIQEYLDDEMSPLENNSTEYEDGGNGVNVGGIAQMASSVYQGVKKVNSIKKFFDQQAMQKASDIIDVSSEIAGANRNAQTLRKFNAMKNIKPYQFNRNVTNDPLIMY